MLAAARRVEAVVLDDAGISDHIVGAIRRVLAALPHDQASHTSLSPPAGIILAWASVELADAWSPGGRRASTDAASAVQTVACLAHGVVHPHDPEDRGFGKAIRAAVRCRDSGHIALAFEGRCSRKQRSRGAEQAWLAQIRQDDAAADPAPGDADGEAPRNAEEAWTP